MHANEIPVDEVLVRALLARQFPAWADPPISRVASAGTVNAMFRLGDDMVVRLPFIEQGGPDIRHEAIWLGRIADRVSTRVPRVLGLGEPDLEYPCPWSVLDWIEGDGFTDGSDELAHDLATFITELRGLDTTDAPRGYRGAPLAPLDEQVRACLAEIDEVDVAALTPIWDEALEAPAWTGEPVWTHGDLLAGNILVRNGRLAAVLDFAASGIGDPACDLMAAWALLPAASRDIFRDAVQVDDATWARGRGWALAQAAIALPYYRETNPVMATQSRGILEQLLAAP